MYKIPKLDNSMAYQRPITRHSNKGNFFDKSAKDINKRYSVLREKIMEEHQSALKVYEKLVVELKEERKNMLLGEMLSFEHNENMGQEKGAGEAIPDDIALYQDFLDYRTASPELLDNVAKTEQVRKLDIVVQIHEKKIKSLVAKWRKLVHRQSLTEKSMLEKSVVRKLEDEIKKLKVIIDSQNKTAIKLYNRNFMRAQNIQILKIILKHLTNKSKNSEKKNIQLNGKLKEVQERSKIQERKWIKERDELCKTINQQEQILQRVLVEKNHFQARYNMAEKNFEQIEEKFLTEIKNLKENIAEKNKELDAVKKEKMLIQKELNALKELLDKLNENKKELIDKHSQTLKIDMVVAKLLLNQIKKNINQLEPDEKDTPTVTSVQEITTTSFHVSTLIKNTGEMWYQKINKIKADLRKRFMYVMRNSSEFLNLHKTLYPSLTLRAMLEPYCFNATEDPKQDSKKRISHYVTLIRKQMKRINEMKCLFRFCNSKIEQLSMSHNELFMEKDILIKLVEELQNVLK